MIISAVRECLSVFESFLTYFPHCDIPDGASTVMIKESTYMVDGIGGGVWEGALILAKLLEVAGVRECHRVVELGCGAGLSGIVAALHGAHVIITDREVDLAEHNIRMYKDQRTSLITRTHQSAGIIVDCQPPNISTSELLWGENSNLTSNGYPDIILGAEITCLRKQQSDLVKAIDLISGPTTIIILSFDDLPAELPLIRINEDGCSHAHERHVPDRMEKICICKPTAVSKYELEMDEKMKLKGYNRAVICTARVDWRRSSAAPPPDSISSGEIPKHLGTLNGTTTAFDGLQTIKTLDVGGENCSDRTAKPNIISCATIHDISDLHYNNRSTISFPSLHKDNGICGSTVGTDGLVMGDLSSHTHHITAYYRPSATSICSRCHTSFFYALNIECRSSSNININSSGTSSSRGLCRHHKSNYVCRYYPNEGRSSLNSEGIDQGGNSNSGKGWGSTFWDCCGLEDRNAPGCQWSRHTSY